MKPSLLQIPVAAALLLGAVAVSLAGTPAAFAQNAASGTVTGTVTDATGAFVPGATITLMDPATKSVRTTVTNRDGAYVMPDVQPGTYNISATKAGFSKDEITGQVVDVGSQSNASFKMAVGSENTVIEVQGSTTDLQTLNASTGATVDAALVTSLPAINRDVATFATLQPGVTPGGMVAGTTADQATFQLDGGSNSSDMDGTQGVYTSSTADSTTGGFIGAGPGGVMPMPQDSVEEFKVSTTGQTADFNNSSGSQSQVVTKRGHDKLHGTLYEYYLDNNFNGNSWQNNYPGTGYTPKPSYHYSRFGAAAGGPIAPNFLGGKTYLFVNYEGFRYPLASTYERAVPSYEFLQLGQLTLPGTSTGAVYAASTLTAADPRHLGMNPTLKAYYNADLPEAPIGDAGNVTFNGKTVNGTFDKSCGALSGSICDSYNVIGYRANILTKQSSNFLATRVDHDFGAKWHMMASYRYYNFQNLTSNQVDIGGILPGDTLGTPAAVAPRPQQPWYFVVGVTTNISSSFTNDFHYSYLRNFWQWKGAGAPPQVAGAGGAIEPLGESSTNVLSPYNVNAQNIRTRIWDGKDNFFRDDLSKLKGNHYLQFGGQYQHNWDYHQRTDNGASINYTPTYQLGDTGGAGNINYSGNLAAGTGLGGTAGAGTLANGRIMDTYFGLVTDTQVANTYSNKNGTLTVNPPATPFGAHTTIPYYNAYITDTWHAKPSLTINFGISYALEMPPTERDGNQVMFTDVSGNAIRVQSYLAAQKAASLQGQVYNPEIGFALLKNVVGGRKYPYDPFYAGVSPRISLAWNPKPTSARFKQLFGDGGQTVFRVGYGRLYGRLNGDVEVLNPLLSPGLVLATQCKYLQSPTTGTGACTQGNSYTENSAFRFGVDGLSPATANAALPPTLAQPYHPGFDGPSVQLASPVDPSLRPNDVDSFNFSIQRQINRRMQVEVGYIGRLIHNEYIMLNPNQIPYNMTLGGQSFVAAYDAIENAFGCTTSSSLCAKSTTPTASIALQPFFEAALGGTNGSNGASAAYCSGYSSCTAAVVAKQASKFRSQQVFALWQALDNNTGGTAGAGFTFARSLMGTATSNATYGSAGQITTGLSMGTPAGYSNYNGGYVSFRASGFHGLTLQENLTLSKALGLGAYTQSTSSITAEDNYNLRQQYGPQGFDQRVIFNTLIVYDTPWYKGQHGIVGRLLGGYTLAPVISAGTGQPITCTTNNSGQNFGGEDGANFTDSESCIFTLPQTGTGHTSRGVTGGVDSLGVSIGTNPKGTAYSAAVNYFSNPVQAFDGTRPPILGIDQRDGGSGPLQGLGYINLDFSIKKELRVFEKYSVEFSGVFNNVMNHLDFSNPSLSLQSSSNWGTTKTQGNSPRKIQMGARLNF